MTNEQVHVLIADDDADDRDLFVDAVNEVKQNTKVITVKGGIELMDYLTANENRAPDVLFLDLNMPQKNGMQCLGEIKANNKLKDMAVVIYSTSSASHDIEATFLKGANVYLQKPNDFAKLKKAISEVITINWQYQTSNLNRDNFILSI